MELADLYGNVTKNLWNARSAVEYDRGEHKALAFNEGAQSGIHRLCFLFNPCPPKVLFECRSTPDQKYAFSDVSSIEYGHNRLGCDDIRSRDRSTIKYPPNGVLAEVVRSFKIGNRLSFPDVFAPYLLLELMDSSAFVLKLRPAGETSIVLNPMPLAVLFDGEFAAGGAFFYAWL